MKISKREIAVYLAEVKNAIQNDQYRIERNVHSQDNIDLFLGGNSKNELGIFQGTRSA